nr:transposase [Virgibacillus dokdonensis]
MKQEDFTILQRSVGKDHIHLLVSCPLSIAPSKILQYLKGGSPGLLQDGFPELKKTAPVGKRIFLCHCRNGNGRNNKKLYSKSIQWR